MQKKKEKDTKKKTNKQNKTKQKYNKYCYGVGKPFMVLSMHTSLHL